jgi:hypothetical protein
MWHYEYSINGVTYRFGTESPEEAERMIALARERDPLLADVGIFEGGSIMIGSGTRHYGPSSSSVSGS